MKKEKKFGYGWARVGNKMVQKYKQEGQGYMDIG